MVDINTDNEFNGAVALDTFIPHDGMLYGCDADSNIVWGIQVENESDAKFIAAAVNEKLKAIGRQS